MESVSIPTTPLLSLRYVSECMGSWIPPPRWSWVYLTSTYRKKHSQQRGIIEPMWSLIYSSSLIWLTCLPPFYILLQILHWLFVLVFFLVYWSHDLTIILYGMLENLSLCCFYCLLECNTDRPVRKLCCTGYLDAYNRHLKRVWCDEPKFTLLLLP